MNETVRIVLKTIGVGMVAGLLIAAVSWGKRSTPDTAVCPAINYTIADSHVRSYVTENELNNLLYAQHLYPVGQTIRSVSLQQIEQTVIDHPMVRRAECYLNPRNEVCVRLTQRVPLLRVQVPGENYLIDRDRLAMPAREVVRDSVLVATGAVGMRIATGQLADFAEWLENNRYWRERVHHVYVQSPQMVYIYLKGANQPRIVMGPLANYDRKLAKLRIFMEKGQEATQHTNYSELDVRFRGQVVGRTN